jgi:hypothetical protein
MYEKNDMRDGLAGRTADREFKSNLFSEYLGSDYRALHVYNVLTGKEYDDSEMEIYRLESVMFHDLYNDLSFVVGGKLIVFFEGQSTVNPNMPVRLLEYLSRYYEDFTKRKEHGNIFSSTLIRLPKPEFIVFYNGTDKQEKEFEYKLSDAFAQVPTLTTTELTVKVYNINYEANIELLAKSKELHDYAALIYKVRQYLSEQHELTEAVAYAIKDCINEGVMVEYLKSRREETYSMLMTQFVIDEQLKAAKNDGKEEGVEEGVDLAGNIIDELQKGHAVEEIAANLKTDVKTVRQFKDKLG